MGKKLLALLKKLYDLRRRPYLHWLRRRVTNRRFLLLSSTCNGGLLLHDLGMPFNTPTVNMVFHSFEKVCAEPERYLAMEPEPIEVPGARCPMFRLGDVTIEGTHYRDNEDFLTCWHRRVERFHAMRQEGYEILLMTMESNLSEKDGMETFLKAPYRKLCFTRDPHRTGPEFAYIPARRRNGYRDPWRAAGLLGIRVFARAADIPAFLNHSS